MERTDVRPRGAHRNVAGAQYVNGLPVGVEQDFNSPYLLPYKHFHDNPFKGLFDPTSPNEQHLRIHD